MLHFLEIRGLTDFTTDSQSRRGPADQLWRTILSQIPTLFGRLVFLASLRDPASGHYREERLGGLLGPEDADRLIRYSHHQTFSQWLSFSLAEQKQDLSQFLEEQYGIASRPSAWGSPTAYRQLIPPAAREVERQLYLADLETLLELLRA